MSKRERPRCITVTSHRGLFVEGVSMRIARSAVSAALIMAGWLVATLAQAQTQPDGAEVFKRTCAGCHTDQPPPPVIRFLAAAIASCNCFFSRSWPM